MSAIPFDLHPDPQFCRESFICLNGRWDYQAGGKQYRITVPYPPESKNSGLALDPKTCREASYRTAFETPALQKGERIRLHFGAVDGVSAVMLNGHFLGKNENGYLPFFFDITDYLSDTENALSVFVNDSLSPVYPYGKQKYKRGGMWYTPVSGIWQTVYLEVVPEKPIERILSKTDGEEIRITVLGGEEEKEVILENGEGYRFLGDELCLPAGKFDLWSPEHPNIYRFTVKSGADTVYSYFARRTIEARNNELLLNGKPYFFHGLLDQGYHPDGIFLPDDEDGWKEDILLAKRLGFNMLRKHIKLEPPYFYYLCDTLGITVFQDMINNGKYSFFHDTALPTIGLQKLKDKPLSSESGIQAQFLKTAEGIQDILFSHPSVVYYTIFNEGWGQFAADAVYERLKVRDPSRIYDATSGWFRQKKSDVLSLHVYFQKFKMPKNSTRPVVLSEFGGYSLPLSGHRFNENGNYGYRNFDSIPSLTEAIVRLYEEQLLPYVGKGLCVAVYTQLTDIEDETNGMVTYDRKVVKVDEGAISSLSEKMTAKNKV